MLAITQGALETVFATTEPDLLILARLVFNGRESAPFV